MRLSLTIHPGNITKQSTKQTPPPFQPARLGRQGGGREVRAGYRPPLNECGGSCRPRPPLISAPNRYSEKQQCRCGLTRSVVCCVVGRGLSPPPYDVGEIPPHSSGNSPTSSPTADYLPQSPPLAIAVSRFRFNRCLVGASHPPRLFNGYRLPLPLERPLQRETAVSVCAHSVGCRRCGRSGAVAPSL